MFLCVGTGEMLLLLMPMVADWEIWEAYMATLFFVGKGDLFSSSSEGGMGESGRNDLLLGLLIFCFGRVRLLWIYLFVDKRIGGPKMAN